VGAEFFVGVEVAALTHQIQIELAEHNRKGIGSKISKDSPEVRAS